MSSTKEQIDKFTRIILRNQARVIGTAQRPDSNNGKYFEEFKNDRKELIDYFIKTQEEIRERREQELYLIAETCNIKGWNFNKYLKTWAAKLPL